MLRQGREVSSILRSPLIASRTGPVVARLDTRGGELQEERSAALQHGGNPDEPAKETPDALKAALREKARTPPQPAPPEPTMPGDPIQQAHAVPRVDPDDLWPLPRIQDRMKALAAETEARERATMKPGGAVKHTAANMLDYWRQRFAASVYYILYIRGGDRRSQLLKKLRTEEEKLMKAAPADLTVQVETLRRSIGDQWQREVDRAADQYVLLASNESQFLTVSQATKPVAIYGLPEWVEGTVEASMHPDTVAKDSTPVAPSVVEFMKEVQKQSGLKAQASNYGGHEKYSPYFGNVEGVGKYSFDVHLGGLIKTNAEGFYEREPLIKFFLDVDRAATNTKIAWIAIYNDFEVARRVNESLGRRRIGFSGGGGGPGGEGSIHHGPAPYILHVHFNIMPTGLAGQYLAGKNTPPPFIDLSK